MIQPGQILQERYRIEKQIGQGGMGAVFVATDERFGSRVAIKETFFTDEKLRRAFEREARLLNSLRHAALPRVSDHFVEGNGQFLVMEFIDGDDLSEQIEVDRKVFDVEEVLGWADQLLDALEYLHTRELPVIHRDIKPQNLKLTRDGRIILLDFGLAKGNSTAADSATAAKSVFGYSRNYASIEQIQGSGTDPRSDLYALAATLYHVLTGEAPADALSRAMDVLSGKPDPLVDATAARPEIPQTVSDVLRFALALSADDRPESASALRKLLLDARQGTAPAIARPSMPLAAPNGPDRVPNAVMTAANAAETGIYNQETRIRPEAAAPVQASVPTVTLPDHESRATRLRIEPETGGGARPLAAVNASEGDRRRRRPFVWPAIGGLALVGAAVAAVGGGVYYFAPRTAESRVAAPNQAPAANAAPETSNRAVNAPPSDALPDVNAAVADPNSNSNPAAPETRSTPAKTDAKPAASTPTPKAATSEKPADPGPPSASDGRPAGLPPEPPPGDDDRRPPPPNPDGRQIPPWVWQKMTPKERRELRQALEMQRQQEQNRRRQRPPQQPTPDQ